MNKKLLVIAIDCLFLNSFNSKKKENVKLSAFFAEHNLPLSALLNLAVFYPGAAFFIFSVAVSTNFFVQVYKLFSPKKNIVKHLDNLLCEENTVAEARDILIKASGLKP